MVVVSLQCVVFLGVVLWREMRLVATDTPIDTMVAVGRGFEPFIFIALFNSLLIVEGGSMLAEIFKQARFEKGKAEGFKEGYEKAKEELAQEQSNNNPPAQQPSEESPKQ
jgi:hypothetical protein